MKVLYGCFWMMHAKWGTAPSWNEWVVCSEVVGVRVCESAGDRLVVVMECVWIL